MRRVYGYVVVLKEGEVEYIRELLEEFWRTRTWARAGARW